MELNGKRKLQKLYARRTNAHELNKQEHKKDKAGPRGAILWGLSFCGNDARRVRRMKPKKRLPAIVRSYLQDIGTAGGSKTSGKKQAAAARNGELGGRPRKKR